jgi:hypothetical protein
MNLSTNVLARGVINRLVWIEVMKVSVAFETNP